MIARARSLPTTETVAARPILATGMHRSGTTWLGAMLACDGDLTYIDEPFNVDYAPRVMKGIVRHYYQYVCRENEREFLPSLEHLLRYRYFAWVERTGLRRPKDLFLACEDFVRFVRKNLRWRRPLLKCPHSVFSIPWFIERLGAQVVVIVRHPAAIASSLKRLQWAIDFRDLLEQPLLMRTGLERFRPQMEECVRRPADIIGQSNLLWRIVYQTVAGYLERFPSVTLVRHEDLSSNPVVKFGDVFSGLGLNFSSAAREKISSACCDTNPSELPLDSPHSVQLDSRGNLDNWHHRLSRQEIARVKRETADVFRQFYRADEWGTAFEPPLMACSGRLRAAA
jgi:hypothetical protein